MKAFAALLEGLIHQPGRNAKLRLLTDYFAAQPDPDRGWALAALTGNTDFAHAKPALLRSMTEDRVDPVLFNLSYDYVGDLAETIALIWPESSRAGPAPRLSAVAEALSTASKSNLPGLIGGWLDRLDPGARWALIKLMTGGLRVGVSARLARTALAQFGGLALDEVEEVWHGLTPPYEELFAWAEGRAGRPAPDQRAPFRPVMLAHPLEEADRARLAPGEYRAEWKWDGIRVQAAADGDVRRLYSRTGDDISAAFPDIVSQLTFDAALDGELLVEDIETPPENGLFAVAGFADLQKRLNRKSVGPKLLRSHPAFLRIYDVLVIDGEDLRGLGFDERRARLEAWIGAMAPNRLDLSPLVAFETLEDLARLRADPPHRAIEGLMLKRGDSPYQAGRPKGPWFKWKRDPHLIDAVLMYAQRGHGKRSSYYSDYTFGVWRTSDQGPELVPVGKAYFGFTDAELREIDRFVRNNTVNRFGPVREVVHTGETGLVIEVAFEGLQRSTRHKSGLAMRFPRVHRLRWDKPPGEADRIETLEALLAEPKTEHAG